MTRPRSLAVAALSVLLAAQLSHAAVIVYIADLDGLSEDPPNASPGTGFAQADYDNVAHTLRVQASFSDLIGTTTAAHIHSPTAMPFMGTAGIATQVPTFAGFPSGVTSGSYDNTFDLTSSSSWNASFITNNGGTTAGAEAALAASLANGTAYFNIHTTVFQGGEIRGFLVPIPEPATAGILAIGAVGLALAGRPKRT